MNGENYETNPYCRSADARRIHPLHLPAHRAGKPFLPMRAIRGLAANVAINIGIWTLAESFRSLN